MACFYLQSCLRRSFFCEYFSKLHIFSQKKIDETVHILALVINQFTGGEAIYDTRHVKEDGALLKIFGDIHIPAPHTSGDFLERFTGGFDRTSSQHPFIRCKISN